MRKKYLSALLFGALLVTSAGTFTSCKDYDDEINNLQEQIDKVVADLESLKTTVENLGGVTDVKIEGGKLLVTAGGKTVEYTIPTGEAGDVEKTVVELDGQDLKVDGKVIGQVGDKVTVNEEGYLCVNGKATEIKAGKYAVLDNDADGVVTITLPDANGELKTVELAKASASVTVDVIKGVFTRSGAITDPENRDYKADGIYWGQVSEKVTWKGPKGDVAANSYLFGQIVPAQVSILPLSYDLSKQDLKLVNSKGEEAKVTVTAEATEDLLSSDTRATAANLWNLNIDIDKDAKSTSFANDDASANVLYALSVNGNIVSGYEFTIDAATAQKKDKMNPITRRQVYFNGKQLDNDNNFDKDDSELKLVFGDNTFHYKGDNVYDYYIAFPEDFENDAEAMGVSIEGNVLKVKETAAGETVRILVHALDVTGNQPEPKEISIVVEGETVEAGEIETVNHVASPDFATKGLVIDLGTTFSGLTADEATKVTGVTWTTADKKFVFATKSDTDATLNTNSIEYFKNAECKDEDKVTVTSWDDVSNIKQIKYAKIKGSYSATAEIGTHNATLTLSGDAGEIKKVTVPVNVTLPSFEEMFTKTGGSVWNENTYTATLVKNTNIVISLANAFSAKSGYDKAKLKLASLTNEAGKSAMTSTDAVVINNAVNIAKANVLNSAGDAIASKNLTAKIEYNFGGKLTVSNEFNINLRSIFEGAEVKYYVNGDVQADDYTVSLKTDNSGNNYIDGRTGDQASKYNGLAISFNGSEKAWKSGLSEIGGITIDSNADNVNTVGFAYSIEKASYGNPPASTHTDGIKVGQNMQEGEGGTLVITFTDYVGIKTVKKINFVK